MTRRMKRKCILVLGAVAALLSAVLVLGGLDRALGSRAVMLPASVRPVVVIDPGHGGVDGGATANGVVEKELNLAIGKKLRSLCLLFGFEVRMTREDDVSIHDEGMETIREQKNSDLRNRLELMTAEPGAAVVSIHMNKFQQSRIRGAQVFYAPKAPGSEELARLIQEDVKALVQPENTRQIKRADSSLFLLYNNTVNPAVLVECGFISNPEEAAQLQEAEYQDRLAFSVCCSLLRFYSGQGQEAGAEEAPESPPQG